MFRLRVEKVKFTPAKAQQILEEQGDDNFRALKPHLVKRYSMEMAHGRWLVNGETIKFDADGRMLDGQHRLAACVAASTPFETWVAYDVDPRTVHTMDSGGKRTISDWLHHKGYTDTLRLAGAISLGWRWETDNLFTGVTPGPTEALTWLARNHDIVDACKIATSYTALRASQSAMSVFTWRAIRLEPEEEVAFRHALLSGEMPHARHPVLALRNYLTVGIAANGLKGSKGSTRDRRIRRDQVVMLAVLIKTWNAVMEGRTLKYLGYRIGGMHREIFPEMLGRQEVVVKA